MKKFLVAVVSALLVAGLVFASEDVLLCNAKAVDGACSKTFRDGAGHTPRGHKTVRVRISGTATVTTTCTVTVETVTINDTVATSTSSEVVEFDASCNDISASVSGCSGCTVTVVAGSD